MVIVDVLRFDSVVEQSVEQIISFVLWHSVDACDGIRVNVERAAAGAGLYIDQRVFDVRCLGQPFGAVVIVGFARRRPPCHARGETECSNGAIDSLPQR